MEKSRENKKTTLTANETEEEYKSFIFYQFDAISLAIIRRKEEVKIP